MTNRYSRAAKNITIYADFYFATRMNGRKVEAETSGKPTVKLTRGVQDKVCNKSQMTECQAERRRRSRSDVTNIASAEAERRNKDARDNARDVRVYHGREEDLCVRVE